MKKKKSMFAKEKDKLWREMKKCIYKIQRELYK